jgi:hypothetical protein
MKSLNERHFSPRQLALLRLATKIFDAIPQARPIEDFRCHEVARIVGTLLQLPVEDGKYGVGEHSWCWTEPLSVAWNGSSKAFIAGQAHGVALLDPYVVGSLPPVRLLAIDGLLPHLFGLYVPGSVRTDIDASLVEAVVERLLPQVVAWRKNEKDL